MLSHFLDATKLTLTNLEIVILIYIFSLENFTQEETYFECILVSSGCLLQIL